MQHLETQSEPGLGHVHEMTGILHYTGHGHDAALTSAGIGKYHVEDRDRQSRRFTLMIPAWHTLWRASPWGGLRPNCKVLKFSSTTTFSQYYLRT